jgi:hypothetical protein
MFGVVQGRQDFSFALKPRESLGIIDDGVR